MVSDAQRPIRRPLLCRTSLVELFSNILKDEDDDEKVEGIECPSRESCNEGFLAAGTKIAASNRSRLASRIEADRCNHRTNINASCIGVSRRAAVLDYTVGIVLVTTQSNSNVKFPVVT
jgi:hypothetical protein